MAEQVQKQHTSTERTTEETVAKPTPTVDATKVKGELDDLLDEIDAVLEENAEEFVSNYVQKGGQ